MTTARLPSLRLLFGDLLKDDFSLRFDRMTLPLSLSLSLSLSLLADLVNLSRLLPLRASLL